MKNDGDLASFAYNTHGGGGHPLPQGKHTHVLHYIS